MAPRDESDERRGGGRPPREAATPSALAPALLRWARERGADIATIANRAGLDVVDAESDEAPITSSGLATMLGIVADAISEPHLALRLPTELVFRRFDAGALAARVAATPRDVLLAVARFSALIFPRLEARVDEELDEIAFRSSIGGRPRGLGHHVDEYVLAFALAHCRRGGALVVPRRVWLTSARPSGELGALVRALGTEEIELGAQHTGFSLSASDAAIRLPSFDAMLVTAAEELATTALALAPRAGDLATAVAAKIEATLPSDVTADGIAAKMKMSARTLQRRLDEEGSRFSVVLDEVRERMARRLLDRPDLPLAEIAYRLGFSDLATFSRAFKRWTGAPPGAYRRR